VRAAAGWNLLSTAGAKSLGPTPGLLKAFVDLGFTLPAPWFWTALFTETLAGIALITSAEPRKCGDHPPVGQPQNPLSC